jgi:salicylate hydroxylase
MPDVEAKYGYPHCTGHRSSLACGLFNGCKKEKAIKFHFSTQLVNVHSYEPKATITVKPRDGEAYQVEVDILLASDGIKSITRTQMLAKLGTESQEEATGQAAYRIMLKRSEMENDPELLELIKSNTVVRWIGPKRHIIAYPVSDKTIYNLSTTQPDTNFAAATNATYTTTGSKSAMLKVYEDFCPLVQRMLDLVPDGEVCEWKLRSHKPLPTWVHGCVALLGDACHPTLPHLSQGAAMAIEDGAVLAECISRAPGNDPATINRALRVYELLRKEWCSGVVDLAAYSGRVLHLGDGRAKEERDKQFAEHGKNGSVPDKWASPEVQKMIYSQDCIKEATDKFEELYKTL